MAQKTESIIQLAALTARQITAGGRNYMAFLDTAAHNYKYSFRDQLLIYAQKPDAAACAQTDFWNKYGRTINQGAAGIALLVDTERGCRLQYVFDVSDTSGPAGRTVPIWQMRPQYEEVVVEALENRYGGFSDRSDFAACLLETAKAAIGDGFAGCSAQLTLVKEGSLLEELDDLNTEVWVKGLLEDSVAYLMLARCGVDPREYFSGRDFARIYDFNTPGTLSILGTAVSDLAEQPLREIADRVLPLYRKEENLNRTFARKTDRGYNDGRTNFERGVEYGTDLSNGGRIPPAQPGRAGDPERRKIWDAAAQLPSEAQEWVLHGNAAQRQTERPSGEDRPGDRGDGGAADGPDGPGAGRDGGAEGGRPDEVGRPDERHQDSGGGSGAGGAGVHRRVSGSRPMEEEQTIQAAENPLNNGLLHGVEGGASPAAPARPDASGCQLGFGHLGNGVTVWNRSEMEGGDYKVIAHISPDRTVQFHADNLPEDVRARVEAFAATSAMTVSATQDIPVFSTPPLAQDFGAVCTGAGEPACPSHELPYIFCEWSESAAFRNETAYSIRAFDRLMKQADDEFCAGKAAAMAKYGTWQTWFDAEDPEYSAFLGYDKVKFTLVLPDGRTFTERQDVGDGDGGVLEFLSQYDKYREIVPILREDICREEEAARSGPDLPPRPGTAGGRFWDAYNFIKERSPGSLVLYQVSDSFELYGGLEGEDAKNASEALNLTLTKRNIPEYGRVSMCSFPTGQLESRVRELNGKGFDVTAAVLRENRHVMFRFPAPSAERAGRKAADRPNCGPTQRGSPRRRHPPDSGRER